MPRHNKLDDEDTKLKCYLTCKKIKHPFLQLVCMDKCRKKYNKKVK